MESEEAAVLIMDSNALSNWLLTGNHLHDHPMPFAAIALPIAGSPGYATNVAALKFVEAGKNSFGNLDMAPMPQFRFNHEDALAKMHVLVGESCSARGRAR